MRKRPSSFHLRTLEICPGGRNGALGECQPFREYLVPRKMLHERTRQYPHTLPRARGVGIRCENEKTGT